MCTAKGSVIPYIVMVLVFVLVILLMLVGKVGIMLKIVVFVLFLCRRSTHQPGVSGLTRGLTRGLGGLSSPSCYPTVGVG